MAAPDGGWGWVIVFASFILYVITGGMERAFGVWYVEILDRYEASAALTEWLIGMHCALRAMLYPLMSMMYARTSLRVIGFIGGIGLTICVFASAFAETFTQLFIIFGVLGGCVTNFLMFPTMIVTVEYFDKRRTLALGIASSGSGLGSFVLSPFLSYCFANLSYFETIVLLSGVILQSLIACALCFPAYEVEAADPEYLPLLESDILQREYSQKLPPSRPPRRSEATRKVRKAQGRRLFEPDLLWNPVMLLYMLGSFVTTMGTFSVLQLVVHFAVTRGETLESASLLLTGTGLTEVLGRAGGGILFSLKAFSPWTVTVWNCCPASVGLSALLITLCFSFWEFLPVVLYSAGSYSFINGFSAFVFAKVFEQETFGPAYSMYSNANGIGILCGTYLAGYMKDASGSYEMSYYIMAGLSGSASVIYWLAYLMVKRAKKTKKYRVYISLKA